MEEKKERRREVKPWKRMNVIGRELEEKRREEEGRWRTGGRRNGEFNMSLR